MPSLGADMDHGTIVEWLIKPGDLVHRGDILATVDTDKALMDIESFTDGVVSELLVEPGEDVAVGALLARIDGPAAAPSIEVRTPAAGDSPPRVPESAAQVRATADAKELEPRFASPPVRHLAHQLHVDLERVRGTGPDGAITRADVDHAAAAAAGPIAGAPVRSSPRARKLAKDIGVDLASVAGSGPQGAVVEADVRAAANASAGQAAAAPPVARQTVRPAPQRAATLRQAIGTLMSRSKRTIPHYYLSTTIDLRRAMGWLQQVNAGRPITSRLVPAALLLKATALAARDVPEMNGQWTDGTFFPSSSVHLGVAVSLRTGGLVAPALLDADKLALDDLMGGLRDLVARARGGRLRRAEMNDATLTVTNLGDLGVESVFGVIFPPQVALVGFGRVREEPFAEHGLIGSRLAVTATLSADHRVSDGLRGGRYLDRIGELLQQPEAL
jgi:pyruvate dehydrogenase E2 component (dihydrolipoamide acetyltransferase)